MSSTQDRVTTTLQPRAWMVPAIAGLIGAVAMAACLGLSTVDPRNYEWLMHGDYALHFLGWHLYRYGEWTWPIVGATPLLLWPVGSSIGLTDSIPLFGFVFKPLSALLPSEFQFIGLWLVLSVALQGVFGVLLMRLVTQRVSLQLLGAVLLILSPPLLYRINHAALTAHWLLLASLWLILRADANTPSLRLATAWAILCAVTAATQPYILLMVAVLMGAAHLQQLLGSPSRIVAIAASAAASIAAAIISLWQSGSLMVRAEEGLEVGGFGEWSTNLLSFIMPTEGPTLFSPGWFPYSHKEQYEGYAYLGAGMLLLAAAAIVATLWKLITTRSSQPERSRWRYVPLLLALIFLYAMALGPQITFGADTLLTYPRSWWGPLRIFRTSGRMVWPVYYALVIAILFAIARWGGRRAAVALSLAVVVQAVDIAGFARYIGDVQAFGFRNPLQNRFWQVVPQAYDGIVLIPSNLCWKEGFLDFAPFALYAGTHRVGINGGITARFDVAKSRVYCNQLRQELREGIGSPRSLYIVRLDLVPEISGRAAGRVKCTAIDGFGVCFTPDSVARWQEPFDIPRSRMPAIAELMRFYEALSEVYRNHLARGLGERPGTTEMRVETLVRYLAYRAEGCKHEEAEGKVFADGSGHDRDGLCSSAALVHELPAADQTFAFIQRLSERVQAQSSTTSRSPVDLEGEAVWIQHYVRERLRGAREVDATATVINAITGRGR